MDKYQINFEEFIKWLVPVRKRKTQRLSLLFQGLKWLRDIHVDFIAWIPEVRKTALVNNQVINLRAYLRERFGSELIEIVHSPVIPTLLGRGQDTRFTIGRGEEASAWIARASDPTLEGFNFIVRVPAALEYDSDELRAVIDFYKVPGSSYIIQEI